MMKMQTQDEAKPRGKPGEDAPAQAVGAQDGAFWRLPRGWVGRVCVGVLLCVVVGCAGVVWGKSAWNSFQRGKWAWEERVTRFTGEKLDPALVAKYKPRGVKPEGAVEKSSARGAFFVMPDSGWVEQVGEAGVSATWGGELALLNLEDIFLGRIPNEGSPVNVSAGSAGGVVSLGVASDFFITNPFDTTCPPGWPADLWSAWHSEYLADLSPNITLFSAAAFLVAAQADTGGDSDVEYEIVGWYTHDGEFFYCGPSEIARTFSISLTNCQPHIRTWDLDSSAYRYPRSPQHRRAQYILMATEDTEVAASIGGASASGSFQGDMPSGDPGAGVVGGAIAVLNTAIAYSSLAVKTDTSYGEVRGVSMSGDVPIHTACSFYSTNSNPTTWGTPDYWVATETAPEGAKWRYFSDGATFKLHKLSPLGGNPVWMGATTYASGPFRFNIKAGRGGYLSDANYPLPSGFQCDVGLIKYLTELGLSGDEDEDWERVWLDPGLSDWYTVAATGKQWNPGDGLKAGTHWAPMDPSYYPRVRESWLEDNEELLEAGVCSNRYCMIALPSVTKTLDDQNPYWPAVDYTHTDVSADKPPGETERPTEWEAGNEYTEVDPAGIGDSGLWVVGEGGKGRVVRNLASRKPLRLAHLAGGDPATAVARWLVLNRANYATPNDTPAIAAAVPVEDVYNWDNSRICELTFAKQPLLSDGVELTLKLTYQTYSIYDPCYTPPRDDDGDRFGVNGDFEFSETTHTAEFKAQVARDEQGNPIAGRPFRFDLGGLRRDNTTHLQLVTQVEIGGLPEGNYTLGDLRLMEDPDTHGATAGQYPRWQPQQGANPWNWAACYTGLGSRYEGMGHLNLNMGFSRSDAQWGVPGTQRMEYNPYWLAKQENPPTDNPTTALNLNEILEIIDLQEQLDAGVATYAANYSQHASDGVNNLGFLYGWDLQRQTSDDSSEQAAIHVGALSGVPHGIPHVKHTVNVEWSTHGRADGLMLDRAGKPVHGEAAGAATDNGETYTCKLLRRPAGDGAWEVIGSARPDWSGRVCLPPAAETADYQYGIRNENGSKAVIGGLVTRQYMPCAPFGGGASSLPCLALTHHCITRDVMVSDLGLLDPDAGPGQLSLSNQRGGLQWSDRVGQDWGEEQWEWGNLVAGNAAASYCLGDDGGVYMSFANSASGGEWLSPKLVAAGYNKPYAIDAFGWWYVTMSKGGMAYLASASRGALLSQIEPPVEIGECADSAEGAATALAAAERYGLLFAAVEMDDGLRLYSSMNRGHSWFTVQEVADRKLPYLAADDQYLWLLGWAETPTEGASGLVAVTRYNIRSLSAPELHAEVAVGPSDEGRAALIRRPVGGELIAVAPKTQEWTAAGATPGIAEYRSYDGGEVWQLKEIRDATA